MAANPKLPRPQTAIAGGLPPTPEWFEYLRQLQLFFGENSDTAAQIQVIIARLEELEAEGSARILGPESVSVFGTLQNGLVQLTLVNDALAPGNTYYYGTGPTGTKGWHAVASALTAAQPGIELVTGSDGVTDIRPDDDLEAVEAIGTTGIAVRTAANTWTTRTITAGSGATVADGDGVAGNPVVAHADTSSVANLTSDNSGTVVIQDITITFDTFGHVLTATAGTADVATALGGTFQPLDSDLTALASNSTNGLWARTGSGTGAARTLTEGAGIDIADGDGVSGNPTISHEDTSSVGNLSSDNSNGIVLQDISFTFDIFGHVTAATAGTVNLDSRYLQATSIGNGLKISSGILSVGESGTEDSTTLLRGDGVLSSTLTGDLTISGRITQSGGRFRVSPSSEVYAMQIAYNSTRLLAGHAVYFGATDSATPDFIFSRSDGNELCRMTNDGTLGVGTTSFGGGSKVIAVANATVVPTSNPTGGGVSYAEGGAEKWRGSSGTVTTKAPA